MPQNKTTGAIAGKTYTLFGEEHTSDQYYSTIREVLEKFIKKCPDEKKLLSLIQKAGSKNSLFNLSSLRSADRSLLSFMKKTLRESLSIYTKSVKHHLKALPLSKKFDPVLKTSEDQYHLFMVEIELVNMIYREAFRNSEYRFALIGHCLRDFRPECRAASNGFEEVCKGCTEDCFIKLGSRLLKKYNIHPYISVSMDLEDLFRKIKAEHPGVGAFGIACVPELALGMRLCIKLGIPPVGIPLDANRCARWMKECHESSFNLGELETLLQ
ncbi:DUF116 domain-containing protein [bacterium]|nr:MAG: DUF116 domain-containing protein [bacterium]